MKFEGMGFVLLVGIVVCAAALLFGPPLLAGLLAHYIVGYSIVEVAAIAAVVWCPLIAAGIAWA